MSKIVQTMRAADPRWKISGALILLILVLMTAAMVIPRHAWAAANTYAGNVIAAMNPSNEARMLVCDSSDYLKVNVAAGTVTSTDPYSYTDGASATGIQGKAILGTDGSALQVMKMDNTGAIQVDVESAIPAGTNNIGDVDLASAIPAGTNNIGDVDLASALPAGTNNIGDVDLASELPAGTQNIGDVDVASMADFLSAGDAIAGEKGAGILGSDGANFRFINVDADGKVTVNVASIAAGTNNIGDVDIASELPAGTQNIGDVDIASDASLVADGAVAGAQLARIMAGSDGTNLQWLKCDANGLLEVIDAAYVQAGDAIAGAYGPVVAGSDGANFRWLKVDSDGNLQVDILAELPAGTQNIGDVDIASIAAGTNNIGDVDVASIAAGTNYIGRVRSTDGTTDEVFPTATFAVGGASPQTLIAAGASGEKHRIMKITISADTAGLITLSDGIGTFYLGANQSVSIDFSPIGRQQTTAATAITMTNAGGGNVAAAGTYLTQ